YSPKPPQSPKDWGVLRLGRRIMAVAGAGISRHGAMAVRNFTIAVEIAVHHPSCRKSLGAL
ncbi:hypothetical protein, partial [Acidovorax sp. Root217]|uniref:hypothetical protein n=1 Tax=Acidovorax sp. Root217 TaxID=1736492 RepID=UPI001F2DF02D